MGARECRGLRKDGSWGARAWEELDAGTTIRRIEPDDTVVTLTHDASTVEAAVLMWCKVDSAAALVWTISAYVTLPYLA